MDGLDGSCAGSCDPVVALDGSFEGGGGGHGSYACRCDPNDEGDASGNIQLMGHMEIHMISLVDPIEIYVNVKSLSSTVEKLQWSRVASSLMLWVKLCN